MFKMIRKVTLISISFLGLVFSPCVFAQADNNSSDIFEESMGDITTVAAMGLGGAILGLSTLSFVEEPKDHFQSILIGGAVGVIFGVGLVAYQQASKSQGLYEKNSFIPSSEFGTSQRVAWQKSEINKVFISQSKSFSDITYSFSF